MAHLAQTCLKIFLWQWWLPIDGIAYPSHPLNLAKIISSNKRESFNVIKKFSDDECSVETMTRNGTLADQPAHPNLIPPSSTQIDQCCHKMPQNAQNDTKWHKMPQNDTKCTAAFKEDLSRLLSQERRKSLFREKLCQGKSPRWPTCLASLIWIKMKRNGGNFFLPLFLGNLLR